MLTFTSPQSGDDARMYVESVTGPLADDMTVFVETQAAPGATPGQLSCPSTGTWTPVTTSGAVSLAQFLSSFGTYANGFPWLVDSGTIWRFFFTRPGSVDGGAIQGEEASISVIFENQN